MATLTPTEFAYVADRGEVHFDVTPSPFGDAELFQRIVPFGATVATIPQFTKVPGIFDESQPIHHEVRNTPRGSLYQARLYRRGTVSPGQAPTDNDAPIGRVDLPSILVESRADLLTTCRGDKAQIKLDVGGNNLCASLATGHSLTRMLLLVGGIEPSLFDSGQGLIPRFDNQVPIALASSEQSARLHRVCAPRNDLMPITDRITPQQDIWYIALAWRADGSWDYVWSDDGVGGEVTPQRLTTRTREVSLNVRKLTCVDDSTFDGDEPTFTLALQDSGGNDLETDTYTWKDMDSGTSVLPRLSLEWSGGEESEGALVSIRADSWHGEDIVPLRVDGSLTSKHHLRIRGSALGGQPGFYADTDVTVTYR